MMSKRLIWLGSIFIMGYNLLYAQDVPIHATPVSEWEELISYDGRFRVLAPGTLISKEDTIDTPIGQLVYHTFYYNNEDEAGENYVYMLSYCDYPDQTIHSDSLDLLKDFFETTMDAAVNSVRGELMYSTDTDLDDYPGKLWRIDYLNGRGIIKTKAIVVNARYYAVQTVTQKGKGLNQATDIFLDSFRLLK